MEKEITCPACKHTFTSTHSRTNLGFKKYECPECKQNFITELTSRYKMLYGLTVLGLITIGIIAIITDTITHTWIFWGALIFIAFVFFKDFSLKKNGSRCVKKTSKIWFIIVGVFLLAVISFIVMQKDPIKLSEEQKVYIGNWSGTGITLAITDDAFVRYQKEDGSMSTSVSGPIIEFHEDAFRVGLGFFTFTFEINKEPYQKGNTWKMIINGNTLSRIASRYELQIPEVAQLNKLVNDFLTLLNNSLQHNDYQLFHDGISKIWQSQIDTHEIQDILGAIAESNIDLDAIIGSEIVYSQPPFLDENNLLILEGYYIGNMKLNFNLRFIYEYPNWKIIGYNFWK